MKLSPKIKERYVTLGETFKHRGVGMILAEGQRAPSEQAVGKARHVAEKKGLKPQSSKGSQSGSLPGSTTTTAVNTPIGSRAPSPTLADEGGEGKIKGELGMPATAAATAASVSGAATRGDACELTSVLGNINILEVGESMSSAATLQEACIIA